MSDLEFRPGPAEKAKAAGLKSLIQVAKMTGQSAQTLINWEKNKPELFAIVLLGCATRLDRSGT